MSVFRKVQSRSPTATGTATGLSRRGLFTTSRAAALAAGALLLAVLVDFIIVSLLPGMAGGWLSLLGNN